MLGYLIRKFVREKVRVNFKDGLDASGYLYSMNSIDLNVVRLRGWWILKNQIGSERTRFHSNEVEKVILLNSMLLTITGKAKVSDEDMIVEEIIVDSLTLHELEK